jgi:hypothetical protein
MLARIRYLNTIAVSIRGGKLEPTDAQREIEACIAQLHELVDSLASVAGIEEP